MRESALQARRGNGHPGTVTLILAILRVTGNSLYPQYKEGDFVIVSKVPFLLRGIRPGDLVVYNHHHHGRRIKRVDHLEREGQAVFLTGTHPESVDSRAFGAVPRTWMLGKVILHVKRG